MGGLAAVPRPLGRSPPRDGGAALPSEAKRGARAHYGKPVVYTGSVPEPYRARGFREAVKITRFGGIFAQN